MTEKALNIMKVLNDQPHTFKITILNNMCNNFVENYLQNLRKILQKYFIIDEIAAT